MAYELQPRNLTEMQRRVLAAFYTQRMVLTIHEIFTETRGKISHNTIRRALAKLCRLELIERLPARKPGRGYTDQFRLARDADKVQAERDNQTSEVDDPLAELDEMLGRYKREAK